MPRDDDERMIELAGVRRTLGARIGEGLRDLGTWLQKAPARFWSGLLRAGAWVWSALDRALSTLGRGARVMIAIAATLFLTGMEWTNAARGAASAFPAYAREITSLGALGAILAFLVVFRFWSEADRAEKARVAAGQSGTLADNSWLAVTVAAFAACTFLIFMGAAGESLKSGEATKESRIDRTELRDRISRLQITIDGMPIPTGLDGDRQMLEAYQAEAVDGWGMPDLAPAGGCKADLDPRPRALCNTAATLRDKIIKGESMLQQINDRKVELAGLKYDLDNFQTATGAEGFMAMQAMVSGRVSWQTFSSWGLVVLSVLFLYINAKILDWLLEVWEARKAGRPG